MTPLLTILLVAIGLVLVALLVWIRQSILKQLKTGDDEQSAVMLQNQIAGSLSQTLQQLQGVQKVLHDDMRQLSSGMTASLGEANKTLGERLDNSSRVIGDIRQRLGQMDEASKRIFDIGREIAELQQTLKAPKLRGNLGEFMLADLLQQVLPQESYSLQYLFKDRQLVDAVIKLKSGMVPVDAKFPLENFRRILEAKDDTESQNAVKAFVKDVKTHVNDIASKYIRTDEGTFDFALMYIPSENIYYEVVVRNAGDPNETVFNYCLKKRVIPVSPNSFYAYLQTILLGLKGMRVEESAREIMNDISRLSKDLERFAEDFRLVGQHIGNASKKFGDAEKRFEKVVTKIDYMEGHARGLEGTGADALPGTEAGSED